MNLSLISNLALGVMMGAIVPIAAADPLPTPNVRVECADPEIRTAAEAFFLDIVGSEASPSALTEALRRFYFRWPVYTIDIRSESTEAGSVRVVAIAVRPTVEKLTVKGEQKLKRSVLLTQSGLQVGRRITPVDLETSKGRLQKYLAYRGFLEGTAEITSTPAKSGRTVRLEVRVREGDPCILSSITTEVSEGRVSAEAVLEALDLHVGDRCDGEAVSLGARRIEKTLQEDGRRSARVEDPELVYSTDRKGATLHLRVVSGPIIDVAFRGNTLGFERDSLLRKAVGVEEERQFSDAWMEATAKEGSRAFYRARGYPKAEIEASDVYDEASGRRRITFHLSRGPKVRLDDIRFEGNRALSLETLKRRFDRLAPEMTHDKVFVEEELSAIREGLSALYQEEGFLQAHVEGPILEPNDGDRRERVRFKIDEGERSILGSYRFQGNTHFDSARLEQWMELRPGDPLDPVRLSKAADLLVEKYREDGYKFVKVTTPPLEALPAGPVGYEVSVEEGPQVKIGEIVVRGNLHTKEYVLRREFTLKSGDIYNPERIRETRRRLLALGFFERVSLDESVLDRAQNTEDIVVSVKERKKRSVILRPGFSTDDGVRFEGIFNYLNMGGTGRNISVAGGLNRQIQNADILEHHIALGYQEPHLLGRTQGRINFLEERKEEQQFDIDRIGLILGLDRYMAKRFRTSGQWELEYRDPFNVQPGAVLNPLDETAARFGSIGTIFDADFRDDLLNPTEGTFHRLTFDLYDHAFLSEADFYQVFLRNNFYMKLPRRFRAILSLRLGFSGTFGDTADQNISEIPIEKRFRLGGNSSLRGFARNCVGGLPGNVPENCSDDVTEQAPGGNAVFNYMFDFLIPIFKDFDFALFTDGGNAYLLNSDFNPLDIRTTAGAGLRYNTFFGPLRLDYGIKLDRRTGESFGEVHFAVGSF